jgi:hypothetical protein
MRPPDCASQGIFIGATIPADANQRFDRTAVPLMPTADVLGPPIRGGPPLWRVAPVPLIAPPLAAGAVIVGLAIGRLANSGLPDRAEAFAGPSGVVMEGGRGAAAGK